tara:strand:- start:2995 stop:3171 length:177 start_codon:yes stop_codon:yes gene_type:complete
MSGHIYTVEEISLIIGAVGAGIASIIYTLKNIKHLKSACLGCDIIEVENDIERQISEV